jgi:hypothetical protein
MKISAFTGIKMKIYCQQALSKDSITLIIEILWDR